MDAAGTEVTQVWKGAEQLRPLLVALDSIEHHPENPRRGDVPLIAESLAHHGQYKPIVLHHYAGQPKPYIVAGNHTTHGARENGWTHIAAVTPEMPDEQADRVLLVDNRASDKAVNDDAVLAPLLQRMMDAGQLEGTGYTPDDVDDLLANVGAVIITAEEEFTGDFAETPEETAARFSAPGEGVRLKEVMLMYPEAEFEEFRLWLRQLGDAWGVDGQRNIIFEAVRRCATSAGVGTEASSPATGEESS
jgi:hypothetical protein